MKRGLHGVIITCAAVVVCLAACGKVVKPKVDVVNPRMDLGTMISKIDDHFSSPTPGTSEDTLSRYQNQEPGAQQGYCCLRILKSVTEDPHDFPVYGPTASATVWTGNAIQGASARNYILDPINLPRGSGDVTITNVTGATVSSVHVPVVGEAAVRDACNEIIRGQPASFPANLAIDISRLHSSEELQLILHANASFFGVFSASASFNLRSDGSRNYFLVRLTESMYQLNFVRPPHPAEFWGAEVSGEEAADYMGPGNPPLYISSVNYGRAYYLLVESSATAEEIQATLTANFLFGSFGGQSRYMTNLADFKLQVFAYGGDARQVFDSVVSGLSSLEALLGSLRDGSTITTAQPISYVLRTVRSDRVVKNVITLEGFEVVDCAPCGSSCEPAPLSPAPQETVDNGCLHDPNPVAWGFSWTPCAGASDYELLVHNSQLGDLVHQIVPGPAYRATFSQPFRVLSGWSWKVRSRVNGIWGNWSSSIPFALEAVSSDCVTGVELFEHINFGGRALMITGDTSSLTPLSFKDITSSLKLHNVKAVVLYEHDNYQGRYVRITRNMSTIHPNPLGFGDAVSSIRVEF